MTRIIREIRFWIAWHRWFFEQPFKLGDPSLGTGEQRSKNIALIMRRWSAREPMRGDFGL